MAQSNLAALSDSFAEIIASVAPHVVEVQSRGSLASGFFWREGLIVTADETLAEEGSIEVELSDGSVQSAALVGRDPATDIALLRIAETKERAVTFSTEPVRAGSLALIVAAAESAPLTAFGVIAASGPAWQSMRGGAIDARIEMDVRLRARAEGGLAVDGQSRPFGMAVRGPRGRTLVIPGTAIERIAGQLVEHGRVPIAYLGAGLRNVPVGEDDHGVMVMTLDRSGPAAAAGLQQGDIVLHFNGRRTAHVGALLRLLRATPVGASVPLGLRRGGSPLEVSLTIGDRPAR
jgi:S1-C subfamily serine protease